MVHRSHFLDRAKHQASVRRTKFLLPLTKLLESAKTTAKLDGVSGILVAKLCEAGFLVVLVGLFVLLWAAFCYGLAMLL